MEGIQGQAHSQGVDPALCLMLLSSCFCSCCCFECDRCRLSDCPSCVCPCDFVHQRQHQPVGRLWLCLVCQKHSSLCKNSMRHSQSYLALVSWDIYRICDFNRILQRIFVKPLHTSKQKHLCMTHSSGEAAIGLHAYAPAKKGMTYPVSLYAYDVMLFT